MLHTDDISDWFIVVYWKFCLSINEFPNCMCKLQNSSWMKSQIVLGYTPKEEYGEPEVLQNLKDVVQ